ncbi:MAG TPA: dTMP kinase [Spirochaetia bacterium]|nr:dTMP kinase [Spirochaetia bacterium]
MEQLREILDNFMVLEGLDGSGTTTQAGLLADRCKRERIPYHVTSEPTTGPVGTLIRRFLRGEEPVHPDTMTLLFAADRSEHLNAPEVGIRARCELGELVISDRYLFSSLAYQTIACDSDFVQAANSHFPFPRRLVYVDVPVEECVRRLAQRTHREIYELVDFQARVQERYEEILATYADCGMEIIRVDGTVSAGEIAEMVWKMVAGRPIRGV